MGETVSLAWGEKVYVDESVKDPDRIKKKLRRGDYERRLYLVTLSATPGNMLEIFSSIFLRQELFLDRCQPVVGMAIGKERAIRLILRILEETYRQRSDYRVDLFLKNRRS